MSFAPTRHSSKNFLAVLIAVITACTDRERSEPGAATTVIDRSGTIERVLSTGNPKEWTLEPILALGDAEGSDPAGVAEFAWVSSVALGPDGHLYIADLGQNQIAVFDTMGGRRHVIGRKGRGPGEFI